MTKKNKIRTLATKPLQMKLFMLSNLPMGLLAGLKITELDKSRARVSVPFKYLNKNPFKSMYFAVMAMAAELSSGILALAALHDTTVPVSMLVLDMHADFIKKAKSKITFSCHDGEKIIDAIDKSIQTGEGETVVVHTEGLDKMGNIVAKFAFTWTFKPKLKR
jgi:acyl-coenzyme A thioesterase PaaI-like protein